MAAEQLASVLQHLRQLVGPDGLTPVSDQELLQRFSTQRDQSAFAALFRRHGPMVWRVCRSTLARTEDAEDAFQATFLVLAQKAGAYPWRPSVAGWLYEVAHRLARKTQAQAARRSLRDVPVRRAEA